MVDTLFFLRYTLLMTEHDYLILKSVLPTLNKLADFREYNKPAITAYRAIEDIIITYGTLLWEAENK